MILPRHKLMIIKSNFGNFLSSSTRIYGGLSESGDHHQLIRNEESRKLVIFFTATGAKPKQFNFWKVGHDLAEHAHILFVNGWCNSWYQDGVRGIGNDLDSTVETIKDWMSKENVDEVFCTGQSMGGYGALLIGGLLRAKIIAFGSETLLDIPHSQYFRKANRSVAIQHQDLAVSFKAGIDAVLLAGEEDPIDVYCAQRMLSVPGIEVHTMRNVGHGPAGYLRNRDRLEPLLLGWINGSEFPEMEEFGTALEHKDFPPNLYEGWCDIRDKNYASAITKLKICIELYPACDEARRLLGEAFMGNENYVEAFEQFSVSYALRCRDGSQLGLGHSLRKMGETVQAKRVYLKLVRARPENAAAYYGVGLCHLKLENIDKAIYYLKKAVKYSPNNTSFIDRLKKTKSLKLRLDTSNL